MPFTLEDIKAPSSKSSKPKKEVELEEQEGEESNKSKSSKKGKDKDVKEEGKKEEPAKPVEPIKRKGIFPVISFKKAEKTREEILYMLLLDSSGDLPRLFDYMDITRWDEKRKWIFLWVDMSKLADELYMYILYIVCFRRSWGRKEERVKLSRIFIIFQYWA